MAKPLILLLLSVKKKLTHKNRAQQNKLRGALRMQRVVNTTIILGHKVNVKTSGKCKHGDQI